MALGGRDFHQKLKALKNNDDLDGIINLCPKYFPYSIAFKTMAVALRKKIYFLKEHDTLLQPFVDSLYQTAVYHRFICRKVEINGRATYLPAVLANRDQIVSEIPLKYIEMGFEYLPLLNQTDLKIIKKKFGAPKFHQDPRILHDTYWEPYIEKAKQFEKQRNYVDDSWLENFQGIIECFIYDFSVRMQCLDEDYQEELEELGRLPGIEEIKNLQSHYSEEINSLQGEWNYELTEIKLKYPEMIRIPETFDSLLAKKIKKIQIGNSDYADQKNLDSQETLYFEKPTKSLNLWIGLLTTGAVIVVLYFLNF